MGRVGSSCHCADRRGYGCIFHCPLYYEDVADLLEPELSGGHLGDLAAVDVKEDPKIVPVRLRGTGSEDVAGRAVEGCRRRPPDAACLWNSVANADMMSAFSCRPTYECAMETRASARRGHWHGGQRREGVRVRCARVCRGGRVRGV